MNNSNEINLLSRRDKDKIRRDLFLYTIKKIKQSHGSDIFIIQVINHIDELQKIINTISKRLIEWTGYVIPEITREGSFEHITELIYKNSRKELLDLLNLKEKESMGIVISDKDYKAIQHLAKTLLVLFDEKEFQLNYLEKLMDDVCPNVHKITGTTIGARLLNYAGSLKKLATISASKIQLYGAEKALFRHLKTGAKSPKYGIIHEHPIVLNAKEPGKAARVLADKIALAAKVDYFKGEYIADKILNELNKRFMYKDNEINK